MPPPRDYYADLELPHTADDQEIKKQFRKLALKYHPDRNPGREQEVNAQFQLIQAAHEVLGDPEQRAKFDASFARASASRYPAASGVRGNPWSNVSQQFPTPPRRNPQPTGGAQRWNDRFSSGAAPTAKQHASPATAARAFESMRKAGSKTQQKQQQQQPQQQQARRTPPPPPPRTEAAKKKAEASFGSRKTGYYPRSAVPGDEPQVGASNYSSSRPNIERQAPMPNPLAQFREQSSEDSYADSRRGSPYSKQGGERTNPFDGIPINRARSAREPLRRDEPDGDAYSASGRRSSSVPRDEPSEEAGTQRRKPKEEIRRRAVPVPPSSRSRESFKSRAGENPIATDTSDQDPSANRANTQAFQFPPSETPASKAPPNSGGPSMYANPKKKSQPFTSAHLTTSLRKSTSTPRKGDLAEAGKLKSSASPIPSGIQPTLMNHSPFERQQHFVLNSLIQNRNHSLSLGKELHQSTSTNTHLVLQRKNANGAVNGSFNINLDDDTFASSSPEPHRFNRSSVDDINFVNGEQSNAWQFNAGSGNADHYPPSRSHSGSTNGRASPIKQPPLYQANTPDPEVPPGQAGFDADGWSDKFGPQTFEPNPAPAASPTRPHRANTRKVRTPKPTAGSAAVVEENSSDEEVAYDWRGRKAHQKAGTVDSPQAMDIDPPQASPPESPVPQPSAARNIPVEPSRPEWRPGNVDGVSPEADPIQEKNDVPTNSRGSEDTEEFRATLDDLKNVAPFAEPKAGFKSFTELKDNLPFESQAANEPPVQTPQVHPLVLPAAPPAPRLPPTVAVDGLKPTVASWGKYLEEFDSYLRQWDNFNSLVVDHFATRKSNILHAREAKGYSFLGARGDHDVMEYYNWLQQDNDVRRRWEAACEEHEIRFREFMTFRNKMK